MFWPFPFTYELPLYAVFLIGLFVGAILGGTATWLSAHPGRRDARALRRKVRAVEYQERVKREREEQEALEHARRNTQNLAQPRRRHDARPGFGGRDAAPRAHGHGRDGRRLGTARGGG